ncbi:MAG: 5'/3'-nucleotidase SurE [Microthrixaceae bacterium]
MRVLVTNDDGLHAPGLAHLAAAAVRAGHDVLAVAPEGNYSGSGAAVGDLGSESRIRCRDMPLAGLAEVQSVELSGPPALCVITAALGAFGEKPEMVLSGINPGLNTGRGTLHSGTVGAALTAFNLGLSAVAVSIAGDEPDVVHWDVAANAAISAATWIGAGAERTVLNVSVPDLPAEDLRDPRIGTLAPMGAVHTEVFGRDDQWLLLGFAETAAELPPDSDSRLAAEGHVVVTPLVGIRAGELDDPDALLESLGDARRPGAAGTGP